LVKLRPFWSNEEAPEFTPAISVRALRRARCLRETVGGRVTHGTDGPPAWQYLTIATACCDALDSRPVVWPCLISGAGSLVPRQQIFIAKAHGQFRQEEGQRGTIGLLRTQFLYAAIRRL